MAAVNKMYICPVCKSHEWFLVTNPKQQPYRHVDNCAECGSVIVLQYDYNQLSVVDILQDNRESLCIHDE